MSTPKESLWTRDFALLCAAGFMSYMAFYAQLPVLVLYLGEKHGITDWQAGLAMAAYTASAIVSRLYSGYLLDAYGRRIVYLLSLVFFGGLFLLYIPVAGMSAMFALRLAHGFIWGLMTTAAQTAVADIVPPLRRGEGIGLFGLFFAIAMAVGPMAGMWMIGVLDYTHLFILEAIACFVALACAWRATFLPAPARKRKFRVRDLVERSSLPMGWVIFLFLMGYGGAMNWISMYARDIEGVSAGWFFTCTAIGTGLVRLLSGRIYDRRGPVAVCAVAFTLYAISLLLLAGLPHAVSFHTAGILLGMGTGTLIPVCVTIANSLVGSDRRGAANATFYTLLESGIGMGVMLPGVFMPFIGLRGAFAVFTCVSLSAAALFYLLAWPWSRRRQKMIPRSGLPEQAFK